MLVYQVVIPARGGSKRFPKKNIHLLNGKPLINYSIEYALRFFPEANIWVNTDDDEIRSIASNYLVNIIDRPNELATDYTSTVEVLNYQLGYFQRNNINCDAIILLQPTSPLRPSSLMTEAISEFEKSGSMSLSTYTRVRKKFGLIQKNRFLPVNYTPGDRSQDLPYYYFENGLLYITKVEAIIQGKIITSDSFPLIIDHEFGQVDIDETSDLIYAEFLISLNLHE